ncbi:unnamed protein product [Peronospora effusa]|nr:unnamed protein product [Peronospora effusa]
MVFPLPLDFFPPLHLNSNEIDLFLQWGNARVQETIDAHHRDQFETRETRKHKWKPLKHQKDLTVYKNRRKYTDNTDNTTYLCTGRMDGTLDEVVMGRYADNTPAFRRLSGIYRNDLVDCAVLGGSFRHAV